jgi:acetoin utilization protein AcuB
MSQKPLTVAEFMTSAPHTIGVAQPLSVAREMMQLHGVRHLPVVEFGRLVGMLSERELDLLESVPEIDVETSPVSRAMSPHVYTVAPTDSLGDVAAGMASRKIGSAVVSRLGDVVGVFTTVDALHALATVAKDRRNN